VLRRVSPSDTHAITLTNQPQSSRVPEYHQSTRVPLVAKLVAVSTVFVAKPNRFRQLVFRQCFAGLVQTPRVSPGRRNPSGSKLVSGYWPTCILAKPFGPGRTRTGFFWPSLGHRCPESSRSNGFRCISHQIPLVPGLDHHCKTYCLWALTLKLGF
jgi:hypothetical protein